MPADEGPALAGLSTERKARAYTLLAEHEAAHASGGKLSHDDHRELHELLAAGGGHMYEGRIPMNDAEHKAVDKILASHDGMATLTRRDHGNTGPVLVDLDTGGLYEVASNGRTKKVG
jgi:hypothetical protein